MWQLTVSVSTGWACIPAFSLGLQAAGMHGGRGCPPVIHLNFSSVFEMASQRPCMINVTTLTCTVLPRVPTEYLKTGNFRKPTGLWSKDIWLAISLLFKLSNCPWNAMHSGEQTRRLSGVVLCPNRLINGYQCSSVSTWIRNEEENDHVAVRNPLCIFKIAQ